MDNNKIDEGLQGNEKIETAIAALQQEASEEMLAHTLTVIRRRMKEGGQFIVAVEPPTGGNQMQIQAVQQHVQITSSYCLRPFYIKLQQIFRGKKEESSICSNGSGLL